MSILLAMRNSLPRGARRRRRSERWSSDGRCDRIPAKRRRSDACLRVRGADHETSRTRAGRAAGGQSETQVRPPERAGPGARGAAILGSGACRDERRARERGAWRRGAAWHGRRHELVTKTCFRGAFGGARLSRSALARSATKAEPRKLRRPFRGGPRHVDRRPRVCQTSALPRNISYIMSGGRDRKFGLAEPSLRIEVDRRGAGRGSPDWRSRRKNVPQEQGEWNGASQSLAASLPRPVAQAARNRSTSVANSRGGKRPYS